MIVKTAENPRSPGQAAAAALIHKEQLITDEQITLHSNTLENATRKTLLGFPTGNSRVLPYYIT